MIVCEEHKLLYLAPPKTGSMTVMDLLCQFPFWGKISESLHAHHGTDWEQRFLDWFIFITVRNPYTRAVSLWRFANYEISREVTPDDYWGWWWRTTFGHPQSFEEFFFHPKTEENLQTVWRCSWHIEQIPRFVDQVIHQERFDELYERVPGLQDKTRKYLNPSPQVTQPWFEEYSERMIRRVQYLWGEDFDEFGYNHCFDDCAQGKFFV